MAKAKWLQIINPFLLLLLLLQGVTGFGRDHFPEWVFQYGHIVTGCALIVLAAVHLALNWSWVRSNYFKRGARKSTKVTVDK